MAKLETKDVRNACLWWWWTSHMTYNYQRLQSGSFCGMMGPLLDKMYNGDPEKVKDGLVRHMMYFNTEPRIGAVIPGMVVALEEGIANNDESGLDANTVVEVKTALMGPLAGIGDTIWAGLVKPIILSILLGYAMDGAVWAAWTWGIGLTLLDFAVTWITFMQGYKLGVNSIDKFMEGAFIAKLTTFLSIVGLFCLGAMIVKYVTVGVVLEITTVNSTIDVGSLMNTILPSLIPLLVTFLAYKMLAGGKSVVLVLVVLFLIGFIGGSIGLLG